jgi:L-iditol 2-dehydrogenase
LDAVIIAVPVDSAIPVAQNLLRGGGKILLFAHTRRGSECPVDLSSICVDEQDIIGSYSSDVTLQKEVARIVLTRRLDVRKLISHQFRLEETAQAVRLASAPASDSLKLVVCHEPMGQTIQKDCSKKH